MSAHADARPDPDSGIPEPPAPAPGGSTGGPERLDLIAATGGPLGMAETALPAVAFVATYSVSGSDTNLSAIVALVVAGGLSLARLVRRQSPRHALTGLVGVAFAAFIATRSGKAENFFLPGLLMNTAYATAFLVSIAVRRPLIGLVASQLTGGGSSWREDPRQLARYVRASWLWVGLFAARLAVQLPLYLAGAVVALGIARTAMGVPLFALVVWLSWLMVRPRAAPAASPPPPGAPGVDDQRPFPPRHGGP